MPKVSVIVPAYNAEKTLIRCLDSILCQTIRNIEVIVVDDGSTDQTSKICAQYMNDPRFCYFYKENGGVSTARNFGIEHAHGEYIGFIDADDTVAPDMYEKMYRASKEKKIDICICDLQRKDSNGNIRYYTDCLRQGVFSRDQIENEIIPRCLSHIDENGNIIRFDWCVLRRLFSREFINKNSIRFDEKLSNSEDCLFVFNATSKANAIAYLKEEYLYCNHINNESMTHKYLPTYWNQRCHLMDQISLLSKDIHSDEFNQSFSLFVLRCVAPSLTNVSFGFRHEKAFRSFCQIKEIVNDDRVRNMCQTICETSLNFEWTRILKLLQKRKCLEIYALYQDLNAHSCFWHSIRHIKKKFSRLRKKR